MKKNIEDTLEDIFIIKNSIGNAKGNYNKLYKILIAFGVVNLIYYLTTIILSIMFKPHMIQPHFNIILNITIYTFLLIYFTKIYREERKSSNKYYLNFLSIWAIVTFLLPLLLFIIRIIINFNIHLEEKGRSLIQLQYLSMLSNILLLCFCIMICGYILKKKRFIVISTVVLFIYLMLSSVYNNIGYTMNYSEIDITFPLSGIYYHLAVSIGYIIIAMILKHEENNIDGIK